MPSDANKKQSFHMDPDEFREHGHAVVDWIADYYKRIESFPVLSQVKPGEIRASLPALAPQQGEAFETILGDVEKLILPGVTHWQSPNFFAYFSSNASGPSILGRVAFVRPGRARHAVGDESCVHGTGDAGARLAGPSAWIA